MVLDWSKWPFLRFFTLYVPLHCVVKSSVCSVPRYLQFVWKMCMVKSESLNQLCISLNIYRIKLFFSNFRSIAALTTRISCNLKVWMNSLFIYSQSKYFLFQTLGPSLSMPLKDHSMVRLGKGQAILGGDNNQVIIKSRFTQWLVPTGIASYLYWTENSQFQKENL